VVIGAGAIGVTFAAELKRAGNGVVLIARGAQLEAARTRGITYVRPDGERQLDVPVHGGPEELELRHDDILILATKTQDAAAALALWAQQPVRSADANASTAGASLALVTTQNGLETERVALREFATVIGGVLALPAHFVEPGVVVAPGSPAVGAAWVGAYPDRADPAVEDLARTLRRANLEAYAVDDISAWKRAKLVSSTTFVLDALYPPSALRERAAELLASETRDVLGALGEVADLGGAIAAITAKGGFGVAPVPRSAYGGTSTWQSLARASGLETGYINGEVVLQARLQGRSAPANAAVTAQVTAAARDGLAPRSLDETSLLATFPQLRDTAAPSARDAVLITPAALARELASPQPPALLDVRWKLGDPDGRRHYADAHLPGAVYVDLDTELAAHGAPPDGRHPLPSVDALQTSARRWGLAEGQPVVVYDDVGGTSAARAWWLLRWAGVADVRILDGGLSAWTTAGLGVEHGPVGPVPTGDVVLSPGHLPVLDADDAAALAEAGADHGVLLDARAGERYRGEVEPVDPRAGHIPGALSAPTAENLDGEGRFLSDAALRERFRALGVDPDAGGEFEVEVGVYCGSGVTAAHEIAALAVIGIDAALYPGSWSAWSNDPARPAATGAAPGLNPDFQPAAEPKPSLA
jgi:thiosulfate/3-mercaptopyruvate sulfurtransferase